MTVAEPPVTDGYHRDATEIAVAHADHATLGELLDALATTWGRAVYLVGAADEAPEWGRQWRDVLWKRYPDAPFVDPLRLWPDYQPDEATTVDGCLAAAARCDVLFAFVGAEPTHFSYREVERALAHGRAVVAHRAPDAAPGDVRPCIRSDRQIPVSDDIDGALAQLRPDVAAGEPSVSAAADVSGVDVEAVHAGERMPVLDTIAAQASELSQQAGDPTITCPCGASGPLRRMYQCYFCDVHLCLSCAEDHFEGGPSDVPAADGERGRR